MSRDRHFKRVDSYGIDELVTFLCEEFKSKITKQQFFDYLRDQADNGDLIMWSYEVACDNINYKQNLIDNDPRLTREVADYLEKFAGSVFSIYVWWLDTETAKEPTAL